MNFESWLQVSPGDEDRARALQFLRSTSWRVCSVGPDLWSVRNYQSSHDGLHEIYRGSGANMVRFLVRDRITWADWPFKHGGE